MIAARLLHRLGRLGVSVRIDGDELVLNPRSSIDEDILAAVREHGRELRILLRRRQLERTGGFSTASQICERCHRLGRVALIDGSLTCSFCVVNRAEELVHRGAAR